MPKKRAKKKRSTRKSATKKTKTPRIIKPQIIQVAAPQESSANKILVENFVSLQRVLTNLSVKLDNLTDQLSKLLDLFEISAKALAEKDFDLGENTSEVIEKLDNVLDQNKTLARGIALMHERPREQFYPSQTSQPTPQIQQSPSYIKEITPPTQPIETPLKKPRSKEIEPPPPPTFNPTDPSRTKPKFESPI